MNKIKSAFMRIDWKDVRRSLGLAAGAAATYIFSAMVMGMIPDAELLKSAGSVFVGTMGTYLVKNLLTNSEDKFLKKETRKE
jgi:hypothetical protein